ncbi:extracellular solute-binding protein [Actinomycetes bacterium KLBMP 9759]
MPATTALRVLCWDDPRCTAPLRAAVRAYRSVQPDIALELALRPLSAFNDQPVEEAAAGCDLLVFDHPMVPRASARAALLPVEAIDPDAALPDTVGATGRSYRWQGRTWGIAVDAACQVAASRPDLLGEPAPATWEQVTALARRRPGSVALPLAPADALCTLLSLSAATRARSWFGPRGVELLVELAELVDPACLRLNPPSLLSALADGGTWAYVPLTFGYSARADPVRWHDAPVVDGTPATVLGGAGLGISASSACPAQALRFALWYASGAVQRDVVLAANGQPAARAVWESAGGFFAATRRTMQRAFQRPQHPDWPELQERAAALLHAALAAGVPAADIHGELADLDRKMSRTA